MKKLLLLSVAVIGVTLGVTAMAGARAAIPTTVIFDSADNTGNPDELNFTGRVASPKAKCRNHRKLVISKRPGDSEGGFTRVTTTSTDGTAHWEKVLDTTGFPDFQVKAPRKRFGRPGHRKTCASHAILLEA